MFLWLVFAQLCHTLSLSVPDNSYVAKCLIVQAPGEHLKVPCSVANFSSHADFATLGDVFIDSAHDFCRELELKNMVSDTIKKSLALALRGNCSFDTKVEAAAKQGYQGVIIVNSDVSHFPVGGPDGYVSSIPCVMVESNWYTRSAPFLISKEPCSGANTCSIAEHASPHLQVSISYVRSQAKKKSNSAPAGHPLPPINVWLISQLSHTAFGVIVFMIALCLCCFMLMQTSILKSKEEPCSNFCARTAQNIVITGLLLSIPISMIVALMFVRLSTLRTSDMSSPGLLHPFNHSETDEQIFQILVGNVLTGCHRWLEIFNNNIQEAWQHLNILISSYALTGANIQYLSLSKENYQNSIFIHPPNFIVSSAALFSMSVPLPLHSLIYQAVALLCCIPLVHMFTDFRTSKCGGANTMAEVFSLSSVRMFESLPVICWSIIICGFCPIVMFVSQKFWLDNYIMMAVVIVMTGHVSLLSTNWNGLYCLPMMPNNRVHIQNDSAIWAKMNWRQLLSGLLFGGMGLNTKLTTLALYPALLLWTFITIDQQVKMDMSRLVTADEVRCSAEDSTHFIHTKEKSTVRSNRISIDRKTSIWSLIISSLLWFHIGILISHGPWLALYKSHTGRWLPNAWPSAELKTSSAYMMMVLAAKPWHHYLTAPLLTISPVHLVGLSFGLVHSLRFATHLARRLYWSVVVDSSLLDKHHDAVSIAYSGRITVLFVWAMGVLVGHSLLGVLGAGFQTRFLMPMLPATSMLTALALTSRFPPAANTTWASCVQSIINPIVALLVIYGALHAVYYGVLFAPLYGDLEHSVVHWLITIMKTPSKDPGSREIFTVILQYIKHYGIDRTG